MQKKRNIHFHIISVEIFRRWWFIKFILTLIISGIFTLKIFFFIFLFSCSCMLKCKQFGIIYLYHIRKYHQIFFAFVIIYSIAIHMGINLICNVDILLKIGIFIMIFENAYEFWMLGLFLIFNIWGLDGCQEREWGW